MSRLPIRPAALAAAAAGLSYAALRQRPPGGDATWSRTNHRGEPVTLLEGPGRRHRRHGGSAGGPRPDRARTARPCWWPGPPPRPCGGYDDLAGSGSSRGFRGHLGALPPRRADHRGGQAGRDRRARPGRQRPARPGRRWPSGRFREGGGHRALAAADFVINAGAGGGRREPAEPVLQPEARPGDQGRAGRGRRTRRDLRSAVARRRPPRSAPPPRCWPRTSASAPCSATPGPTHWARLLGTAAATVAPPQARA